MVSKSAWASEAAIAVDRAEVIERQLVYHSGKDETSRKASGSYYTPADVARHFWLQLFDVAGVNSTASALRFLRKYRFVEPAAGAGILFFALLEQLANFGISPQQLSGIDAVFVDIDKTSNEHLAAEFAALADRWGVIFSSIDIITGDFLSTNWAESNRPLLIFGNPPFVSTPPQTGWRNSFAAFLEKAVREVGTTGMVHFILPLSVAFSRDYRELRKQISKKKTLVASHYDNIPDCLFKAGKPLSQNTNKANSQRCTILTVVNSRTNAVLSTKLHRWVRSERNLLLGTAPRFIDVTELSEHQILRPSGELIVDYLKSARDSVAFSSLISIGGKYRLFPASVARNYLGIRPDGAGAHELAFADKTSMLRALLILTSDLFFEYWLTTGDGFHVTKSDVLNFPVSCKLQGVLDDHLDNAERMWRNRTKFEKRKLNAGAVARSYDFSGQTNLLALVC